MAALPQYVMRVGNALFFRRGVPAELRPVIGKREWKVSLKTDSAIVAAKRVPPLVAKTNDEMHAARVELGLVQETSEVLWNAYGIPEDAATYPQDPRDLLDRIAQLERALALDIKRQDAQELVNAGLDQEDAEAVVEHGTKGEDYRAQKERAQKVEKAARKAKRKSGGEDIAPSGEEGSVWALYEAWKKQRSPSPATVVETELAIRKLFEFIGEEIPANEVTEEQAIAYGLDMLEKGNSPTTVNKKVGLLCTIFRVARKARKVSSNPFEEAKIDTGKRGKAASANKARLPFDGPNLEKLVRALPEPRLGMGLNLLRRQERYWVPLLAMYTGARLGEIAPLERADVREEAGVWCVAIRDDLESSRSIKNEGSRRLVPVHSTLIALGFLNFVKGSKGQLFPLVDLSLERPALAISKRMARLIRVEAGIDDPRIVFHSFRHSLKDWLRSAGVSDFVNDQITGHAGEGQASRGYGTGAELRRLKDALESIEMPIDVKGILT
ncbi:MAG: DUF6538 domain-containing protein [Rhodospirillaceae bacterium]